MRSKMKNIVSGIVKMQMIQIGCRPCWLSIVALLCGCAMLAQAEQPGGQLVVRNLGEQQFAPIPGSPPCMRSAVQHGDPRVGPTITLIHLDSGCAIPWHWHTAEEQIMLFGGSGRFEAKGEKPVALHSGGYVFVPAHRVERFTCSQACTIFLYTNIVSDIHFVDAAGKEIPYDAAVRLEKSAR